MTSIYWLGAHKTATTFLQKTLDQSQTELAASGVFYMELDEFRRKYTRPLLDQDPDDEPAPNEFDGDEPTKLVFDENIPGYVQHGLSAAGFFPDAAARVAAIRDHLDLPVDQIVFGVRRYDTYLASLYTETLKSTPYKTWDAWLQHSFRGSEGFARLNWHDLLRDLMAAFPDVPVKVYFHEQMRGNEARLLAEVTGMDPQDFSLVSGDERVGFSQDAVDRLHTINETRQVAREDVHQAVRRLPSGADHPPFRPWNVDASNALYSAYERDRAAIMDDPAIEVIDLGPPTTTGSRPSSDVAARPDVSVIIPVHNAESTLPGIVDDFLATPNLSVQVILVDDASRDGSADLVERLGAHPMVQAHHHVTNKGAGVARNTGFGHAEGRYTLFFDADDIVHPAALLRAVEALDASGADVAMMPYHYLRSGLTTHADMNTFDISTWQKYMGSATQRLGTLDEMPRLLGFSAYPWNKVLRTARYHETGLRFGSTPVHNDILGHWHTLLFARRVLLVNTEVCTHIVDAGGTNLTNEHSRVRLSLFDALDETYDLLEQRPERRNRYSHHYWSTVIRVAGWAGSRIAPEHRQEFNQRLQDHLLRANLADFARMRMKRDPSLADAIIDKALA